MSGAEEMPTKGELIVEQTFLSREEAQKRFGLHTYQSNTKSQLIGLTETRYDEIRIAQNEASDARSEIKSTQRSLQELERRYHELYERFSQTAAVARALVEVAIGDDE